MIRLISSVTHHSVEVAEGEAGAGSERYGRDQRNVGRAAAVRRLRPVVLDQTQTWRNNAPDSSATADNSATVSSLVWREIR